MRWQLHDLRTFIYPKGARIEYEESLSATASRQKRWLQIVNMQQCLEAETLKGIINESGMRP
jgi:hypothetical protein